MILKISGITPKTLEGLHRHLEGEGNYYLFPHPERVADDTEAMIYSPMSVASVKKVSGDPLSGPPSWRPALSYTITLEVREREVDGRADSAQTPRRYLTALLDALGIFPEEKPAETPRGRAQTTEELLGMSEGDIAAAVRKGLCPRCRTGLERSGSSLFCRECKFSCTD